MLNAQGKTQAKADSRLVGRSRSRGSGNVLSKHRNSIYYKIPRIGVAMPSEIENARKCVSFWPNPVINCGTAQKARQQKTDARTISKKKICWCRCRIMICFSSFFFRVAAIPKRAGARRSPGEMRYDRCCCCSFCCLKVRYSTIIGA